MLDIEPDEFAQPISDVGRNKRSALRRMAGTDGQACWSTRPPLATIERCVVRRSHEYDRDPAGFATDFTRQDAAILNILRACEAALDMGQHLIRRERLGVPLSARDVFALLAQGGWIDTALADRLKRMVGFRNIAGLQLPITVAILKTHLDEFLQPSQALPRGTRRVRCSSQDSIWHWLSDSSYCFRPKAEVREASPDLQKADVQRSY